MAPSVYQALFYCNGNASRNRTENCVKSKSVSQYCMKLTTSCKYSQKLLVFCTTMVENGVLITRIGNRVMNFGTRSGFPVPAT